MAGRVTVRQGGADGAGTTDFSVFSGLKGAVAFDHPGTALISGGMRWADGDASAATFKILDPNGELPRTDGQFNLPAHALVTFTEDAAGCAYWWHRGRMSGPTNYGRGAALAGDAREFDATSDDGNVELKGQAFTEAWVRPQETDYARLVALQAYTLNGSSSTSPHHRNTCQVVVLDAGHFCKNANNVTMPATTYPIGTQPLDVVADCGTTAGKDYGVVLHHAASPGGSPTTVYETWNWDTNDQNLGGGLYRADLTPTHVGSGGFIPQNGGYNTTWGSGIHSPSGGQGGSLGYSDLNHDGGSAQIACVAGHQYRFTGYFNPFNTDVRLQVIWEVAGVNPAEVSRDLIAYNAGWAAGWDAWDATFTAPATATQFQLKFTTGASGGVDATGGVDQVTIYTDNGGGGTGDCTHLCLQYIVPTDLTTNPCTLKISDVRSEVDEDTATPPTTYAPRWLDGKAATGDTQDQLSALIYQYQTVTGSGAIFTQNTADVTSYDYWCEAVSDSQVETPAEAIVRAPAILATRRTAHVTFKVSVPLAADQLHLMEAGMAISLKSAAAVGAQPHSAVTYRIVQTLKEPRNDGTYWVHMELNRPQRMVPGSGNIGGAVGQPTKATIVSGTFSGQTVGQALTTLDSEINVLTTLGDMLYRGGGGSNTRLAIGPSNTHLRSDGTKPVWSPESSTTGLTDPMTTIGDIIVRNASNVTARLGIGASNTYLKSTGSGAAPIWDTVPSGGGGSGITHSYLGYNTIGGSTENVTNERVLLKKVTVSTAGIITSIGAYITQSTDNVVRINAAVLGDSAGSVAHILALTGFRDDFLVMATAPGGPWAPEWVHVPIGLYVPAGDYWLAVQLRSGGTMQIYYDGSGSDRYYNPGAAWIADGGRYTETDSTRKYSIRASIIS